MSQDIRSFFKVLSKKSGDSTSVNSTIKSPKVKKTKKVVAIIDSDDEDFVEGTPEPKIQLQKSKRRPPVLDSDSEDDSKKKRMSSKDKITKSAEKLKPVDIDAVFNKTVHQSKLEYIPEPTGSKEIAAKSSKTKSKKKKDISKNTEIGIHEDDDFERTLLELDDDDALINNLDQLDQTVDEALAKDRENDKNVDKTEKPSSSIQKSPGEKNMESKVAFQLKDYTDTAGKSEKKRQRKLSEDNDTPKKKKKIDLDSTIDSDQEKYEKRRYSAALYQKYLHRGGPKNHGMKEYPKGKPNCLKNMTFLRTGVLDSLESEEFENLIKEHGGRVVHAVSRKLSYIVVGEDAGPSKLAKAQSYKIPEISEDDLLDIILVKSGMKPKFAKTNSDDTGFGSEEQLSPKKREDSISPPKKDNEKISRITSPSPAREKDKSEISSPKKYKNTSKNDELKYDKSETEPIEEKHTITEPSGKTPKPKIEEPHKTVETEERQPSTSSLNDTKSHDEFLPLTEKYRPSTIKAIIGQQDSNSNMNKLKKWLENWYKNQKPEAKAKLPRPSPWNQYDGAYFKCALLSGSPGVGKTTTATLVARELGYDIVEFNASDTRSKKLLHEEVAQLLHNTTIAGYATGKTKTDKKRVLLMDEVDGMAGNEDRGGMQELISLIKSTNIPIICMCNDRNHQKMRSLVTYCYDLRFAKPPLQQIRGAMLSICFKEGIKIRPDALAELIAGTGCDVRQTLNHLSMWSAANSDLSIETVQKESKASQKDIVLGPWDIVKRVFNESENKGMTFGDRSRLFFYDYSMGPLFVQENYIHAVPNCKSEREKLIRLAKAADSLSIGDLFETKIRSSNNWSLLDSQSYFSSVFPGYYMTGVLKSVNFPSWLGKNSKKNKFNRMLGELHIHTRTCTSGSKLAMRMDYLVPLRDAIIKPLRQYGTDGIKKAVEVMKDYSLLRDDLNNLVEMCQWSGVKNPFNDIDSKVKSAFTRAYNKEVPLLPFSAQTGVAKKRVVATEAGGLEDEDDLLESDGHDDDLKADSMIKIKTKKDTSKKESEKAGSSKGKIARTPKPKGKAGKK